MSSEELMEVGDGESDELQDEILKEMRPFKENDEFNANIDFDRKKQHVFENNQMWHLVRKDRNAHSHTIVGKIRGGEFIPNPSSSRTGTNLSTLWLKKEEKHTGLINNHVRVFAKVNTTKRLPTWCMAFEDIGLIKMDPKFFIYFRSRSKGRAIKNSYEIINNELIIYMTISNKSIALSINAYDATEQIRSALSKQLYRNCPLFCWNEIIPLINPQYHAKRIAFPKTKDKTNEYNFREDSGDETDSDSEYIATAEQARRKRHKTIERMYPTRAIVYNANEEPNLKYMKIEFENIYNKVSQYRTKPPRYPLSLDNLTCTLREYQIEAVEFMIHRELNPKIPLPYDIFKSIKINDLYYYPELGVFSHTNEVPKIEVVGGILGDEMGLGKTVELLALIFSLRKENIEEIRELSIENPQRRVEIDPIKECVEYLVGTVSAQEEGIKGLNCILKSKLVRSETKRKNVYFNINSRHYKEKEISFMEKISCKDCGATCLRSKMHWDFPEELFTCPDCTFMRCEYEKIESSATLVIVPQILLHQWFEEIKKHVKKSVKIDMYLGVEKDGYKHPMYLSQCDIVLTSYETLRCELEYTKITAKFNLRKRTYDQQKQVTTPLMAISWWRICLDESQIVDGWSTMASKMVGKLVGRARWCVSGTPMTTGINDFFGMVSFLDLYPFTIPAVWEAQFLNPFYEKKRTRFYDFISHFFWRNSTKSVKDQLELPTIKYETTEVNFSPLEERLYQDQLSSSVGTMSGFVHRYPNTRKSKIVDLPHDQQKILIDLFDRLRLYILTGGSHVKSKAKASNANNSSVVYSSDLLFKRLFGAQRNRLEERIREYTYTLCGLGGMYFLYRAPKAEECYSKLKAIENVMNNVNDISDKQNFEKKLHIDTTQMIHFCRALLDLNEIVPLQIYNRDNIYEKFTNTTMTYVRREATDLEKIHGDWQKLENDWIIYEENFSDSISWALACLEGMKSHQLHDYKEWVIQTDLDMAQTFQNYWEECRPWTFPYRIFFYIQDNLERHQGNLEALRRKIQGLIFDYKNATSETINGTPELLAMMECNHNKDLIAGGTDEAGEEEDDEDESPLGSRRSFNKRFVVQDSFTRYNCPLCELHKTANGLEKDLYLSDGDKRIELESGDWYVLLKELSKKAHFISKCQKKQLWKWFEQCRKTVFLSQRCIVSMKELICRHRELRQAEKRLKPGMSLELPLYYIKKINQLPDEENQEVATAIIAWTNRVDHLKSEINRIHTQIKYVSTLSSAGNNEDRQCPVCFDDLENVWNVFPCAHYVCVRCFSGLKKLRDYRSDNEMSCVVCRATYQAENVVKVMNRKDPLQVEPIPGFQKGQINVKYDAIIRKLLQILNENITNKVLIFSSLAGSLDSFCNLLNQIKVNYNRLYTLDPLKIANFRKDPNIRVLVISLQSGSSGLNLTQANHVFFLEPTVEKATVAQAIGRMARMGQFRAMTVHNFVVKGSIEEEIMRLKDNIISEEGWTVEKLETLLAGAAMAGMLNDAINNEGDV